MKTMICSQCGAGLDLTEDKEFFVCPACGTKVYNDSLNKSLNFDGDINIDKVNINVNSSSVNKNNKAINQHNTKENAMVFLTVGIVFILFGLVAMLIPIILPSLFWPILGVCVLCMIIGIPATAIGIVAIKK